MKSAHVKKSKRRRCDTSRSSVLTMSEPERKHDCLSSVPLELLAEILSSTSPKEVLALARCSRYFCYTLVTNPNSSFIWRRARQICLPEPIPDPTPNFTEPAYASFLFDGGKCENCGQYTDSMYKSFALRLRICPKVNCFSQWKTLEGIVPSRHEVDAETIHAWVLSSELSYSVPNGVANIFWINNSTYCRRTEWAEAVKEYNELGEVSVILSHAEDIAKRPKIMEHAKELSMWSQKREELFLLVKAHNDLQVRKIATEEGWDFCVLINTPTFHTMYRSKKAVLERITDQDFSVIRPIVEQELIASLDRRRRRIEENAYHKKREHVATHYQRMKTAKETSVMPTLSVFRAQPIIQVLQNRKAKADIDVAHELTRTTMVQNVLRDNLETWVELAREKFAVVLGHPQYRSISEKKLHPVDRLTARFICSICSQVKRKQATDGCLDFAGACNHSCIGLTKKELAKVEWKAHQFLPDEKVIKTVREVLKLLNVKEEDTESIEIVKASGNIFLCNSCHAPIVMNFNGLIGHCKRHEEVKLTILPPADALAILKHPIEYGLCAELVGPELSAPRKRALKIYGCRHCQQQVPPDISSGRDAASGEIVDAAEAEARDSGDPARNRLINEDTKQNVAKRLSFDGLRCHLRARHAIENIRDEDIFRFEQEA